MFNLDNIRGIYENKKIAILGSAPSVRLYKRSEDIAIGVNGAGKLLKTGDYFLSADERAYTRSWFKNLIENVICILRPQTAIYSERLYPDKLLRDEIIKKYELFIDIEENSEFVYEYDDGLKCLCSLNDVVDNFFLTELPNPVDPHIVLKIISLDEPISKEQNLINAGGTSCCMALQIAYIMGAKEIHFYGVEFSNDLHKDKPLYSSDNYFYKAEQGETGMTLPSQRKKMDAIINEILSKDVKVFSHGPTKLENTIKLEK